MTNELKYSYFLLVRETTNVIIIFRISYEK